MKPMTKIASTALAAAMLATGFSVVGAEDEITVTLNGTTLEFDVPPQIIDDRTLVPLRAIFEALGAAVDWDGATQTVTSEKEGTTVQMTIGSAEMLVNGNSITLDVPPQLIDDRTLVPVRAVAESFGAEVDWDGEARNVIITTDAAAQATPAPAATPTAAPTATPTATPTAAPETDAIPIEYDAVSTSSDSVKGFKIKSYTVDENGDYTVTFYVETYLEGPGSVAAYFDCLDASGKVLATIGDNYKTVDYQLTPHTDTATVPAGTVKIVLSGK